MKRPMSAWRRNHTPARPPPTSSRAIPIGARPRVPIVERPGIVFRNEMGRSFRLTRALFLVDGVVLLDAQSPENESLSSEIPVALATPPPGDHVLKTLIQLHGY